MVLGPRCWWWSEEAASVTSISFLCSLLMEMIGGQKQCLEEDRYLKKDSKIGKEVIAPTVKRTFVKEFIIYQSQNTLMNLDCKSIGN